jgi:hypothetical protein
MVESSPEPSKRSNALAVLTGNGVSIGFEKRLQLHQITADVLDKFEKNSEHKGDIRGALVAIASLTNGNSGDPAADFEALVGAFDQNFLKTKELRVLAEEFAPSRKETLDGIRALEELASEVNRVAVSYILETIFDRSRANIDEFNPYILFVEGIVGSFKAPIHFGNLNYDALLLSALLAVAGKSVSDGADGRRKIDVSAEEHVFKAQLLREKQSDFPLLSPGKIRLLHLHGSLTYWADEAQELFIKIKTEDLRQIDQWDSIRAHRNKARPVVVLTNQQSKTSKVRDFPFSLAYSMFGEGLEESRRWLIAGYSFRDHAANKLLREKYRSASLKPRILVVTLGEEPTDFEILRKLDIRPEETSQLTIFRDGVEKIIDSPDWLEFCSE